MILDGSTDLRDEFYRVKFNKNPIEAKKNFIENTIPKQIIYFENLKKKNNGDWFVGNKLSIADITAFDILFNLDEFTNGLIKKNEILKKFIENFESLPKYSEYKKSSRFYDDA